MKVNAASEPCNLGGGVHRLLGIMLTIPEYKNVLVIEYVRPAHPGILSIPVGTMNYETTRLTSERKDFLHK